MELGERNKFFRISKLLCLAFLLFAVSTVNASPTITRHSDDLSASLSLTNTLTTTSGSVNTIVEPARAELANLARKFLQPPESSAGLLNVSSNSVRPLPAVPATALMLLTGFLCVSLYRDRKVWLTALMGLLWVSQAGIQTLPRLAHHFSHKNHTNQQIRTELTYPYYLVNSHRLRSDIDGTRYIGLLHHLGGIPDDNSTINSQKTSQPAIIFSNSMASQFYCLTSKAGQFIYFTSASISNHLSRGPPLIA